MAITRPSCPTMYFWKFHETAPAMALSGWVVRKRYSGHWSSPLTEILAKTSKVAFFLAQNVLISAFVPGSWPAKLLAGKARIRRPLSL